MRYSLQRKLFSIGGDSMIRDDRGRDVLFVDGAAIALSRRLVIKDMSGAAVAEISKAIIALTPTFEIKVTGGVTARVSMKLLSLTDRLKVDVPGPDDLEARGDLFHHEYGIYRGGRQVAHVSKAWIALTDSYGIDVDEGEDQALILSVAVVIDEILEMKEKGERE